MNESRDTSSGRRNGKMQKYEFKNEAEEKTESQDENGYQELISCVYDNYLENGFDSPSF